MKNKLRILMALLAITVALTAQSCSQDPIDKALDNYETVISKLEKQSVVGKKLSLSDMMAMQQEVMQGVDINSLMQKSLPTEKQQKRAIELGKRLQKLMRF